MRCSNVLHLIDDHVDGLLPAGEAEQVRDHLDECRDCRETALAAKAASTSLTAWGDLDPPAACFDAIWQQIRTLPEGALDRPAPARAIAARNEPGRGWLARFPVPLAAAALVVAWFAVTEPPGVTRAPSRGGSRTMSEMSSVAMTPIVRGQTSSPRTRNLRPGEEAAHKAPPEPIHYEQVDDGLLRVGPMTPATFRVTGSRELR